MGAHGGAGRVAVLVADGVVDALMLAMHFLQIGEPALGHVLQGLDAGARNDHRAQIGHQVGKVLVAGGAGDFHVELEVGPGAIGILLDGVLEVLERGLQLDQVGLGAPLCGQACGLGLQADAQLQQGDDVGYGGKVFGGDLEVAGVGRLDHKSADAVARFHQARGLELGDRLADDGPADVKPGHEFDFGGQLVARLELPLADIEDQGVHDFRNQAARSFGARKRGRFGGGAGVYQRAKGLH